VQPNRHHSIMDYLYDVLSVRHVLAPVRSHKPSPLNQSDHQHHNRDEQQ